MKSNLEEPIVTVAKTYDGWGYWRDYRDLEHRKDWFIDFTPTYSKAKHNAHILNRVKLRQTWFFKGYGPNQRAIVKKKFLIRAAEQGMVFLFVHRQPMPPMSDDQIRKLEEHNEKIDLEKEKLKNKVA